MPEKIESRLPLSHLAAWLVAILVLGSGCDMRHGEGEEGRRRGHGRSSEEQPREGDETVPVRAERARLESIAWSLEASAPVEALYQIEVHPEVAGRIVEIDYEVGRRMEAGSPLLTLEDPALVRAEAQARFERERKRSDLEKAKVRFEEVREQSGEIELDLAELVLKIKAQEEKLSRDIGALERIEQAYRANAESRAKFDEAKETVVTARNALSSLAYEQQRKELALAKLRTIDTDRATIELRRAELEVEAQNIALENIVADLAKMRLTCPSSGIVLSSTMARGMWVTRETAVLTLALQDPLVVRLRFPEREVGMLESGQPVQAMSPTAERLGLEIRGEVVEVSQAIEATSGTVQVLVRLLEPPPEVRPGMLVRCRVEVLTRDEAVIVPKRAVIRQNGRNRVFRVEEGRAVEVPVELGYERDDEVEIRQGLSANDLVVTIGNKTLKDGTTVKVLPTE